mgnify:CR=1 FL=1
MGETIDLEGLGRCEVPSGVDLDKLARGWVRTLEGVRKAFEGVSRGVDAFGRALRCAERRRRRREARRGTRGRRGARSVGPWGVAWPMIRMAESTGGGALDGVEAPRDPFPDCPHGGHGGRLNESVLYCETCLKSEAPHG